MQPYDSTDIDEMNLFKERLTIALKVAKICVFEVDLEKQLYTFFENAEDIFGVTDETILNDVRPYSKLSPEAYRLAVSEYFSHPDDELVIANAFNSIFHGQATSYEARMRAGGSDFVWCKIDVTPVLQQDKPVKMIGVITDISHLKSENDLLKKKANMDSFTGLCNKAYSIKRIQKILRQEEQMNHAFVLLDIDNFKSYNDTYGHYEGDKAIKELASVIKKNFRSSDVLGRFGGDEFMILLRDFPGKTWLCKKLEPIVRFQNGGHSLTTSIGIAIYPQDATIYEDLFQKADTALYRSKIERSSFTFFSELGNV